MCYWAICFALSLLIALCRPSAQVWHRPTVRKHTRNGWTGWISLFGVFMLAPTASHLKRLYGRNAPTQIIKNALGFLGFLDEHCFSRAIPLFVVVFKLYVCPH